MFDRTKPEGEAPIDQVTLLAGVRDAVSGWRQQALTAKMGFNQCVLTMPDGSPVTFEWIESNNAWRITTSG